MKARDQLTERRVPMPGDLKVETLSPRSAGYEIELNVCRRTMAQIGPDRFRHLNRKERRRRGH